MSQTASQDLRCRVIAAVDGGMSRNAAARRFGVGISRAIRWVREWRSTGVATAKLKGGDLRSHRIEAFREVLLSAIETQKDVTLVELAAMLERDHAAVFAPSTIWRLLDRHGMTFKKTAHASEQERPDVAARREAWFEAQPDLDPARLVFIDETGVTNKMARRRGRARHGQRCRAAVPHGHWMTTTFTGALRLSGMTAPMVLAGPMNGDAFEANVEQVLVPDTPVRRGRHHGQPACASTTDDRAAIEAAGAVLRHLPPYSLDFNPIENAFAKLKALLRKAAARSIDDLWNAIRDALLRILPSECANYFKAAGYEPD